MAETKLVRGLLRGLKVLRILNKHNAASALELSRESGIPRPTVHRLLDTLIDAGYVAVTPDGHRYCVTMQCRLLSHGFNDEAWVAEIAGPLLAELGREVVWPTDIATPDHDRMLLRDTTHPTSPLSISRENAGFRAAMLESALGRTYISFCSDDERETILGILARSDAPEDALARNRPAIERMVSETRLRGYGIRERGIVPQTGSIAVPVMSGDRCIACINIHYILSAMTTEEAARRYLNPMQACAARIQSALEKGASAEEAARRSRV